MTVATGCGKKGPPLPPLVKLPAAPADLTASRHGAAVDVQFTVPAANTDGTRPANVSRVDVYAITAARSITDDQILKYGAKIASLAVKAPRDPNLAVEPDDPDAAVEPVEGQGLDQGAVAHATEQIAPEMAAMFDLSAADRAARRRAPVEPSAAGPLLGPFTSTPARTYVAVGVSPRGRRGQFSKRALAPLLPAPSAPAAPTIAYDEKAISVTWAPVAVAGLVQEPATGDLLPAKPLGVALPTVGYNVYDVAPPDDAASPAGSASTHAPLGSIVKLTDKPTAEPKYTDARITWGQRRCYTVRAVATIDDLSLESEAAPPQCTTLTDRFPPAPPKNLQAVAGEAAISLIWDANTEADLAGYILLRRTEGGAFEPVTPAPIQEAGFTDHVQTGVRHAYQVKAVDKAGNVSEPSATVEESARE